jgi:hypothetical protein
MPSADPGHGEVRHALTARRAKSADEIGGKEGRVARGGDREAALGPIGARPLKSGKNAGKRPGIAPEPILDHTAERRCRVAVALAGT